MAGLPAVGEPAPDFTLPSTDGSDVTLSRLRGRNVLLAFFPEASTRVCTAEMCAFSEDYDRFREADAEVLPISVDPVPALREFKEKERLSVELLSDVGGEVCRRYGTMQQQKPKAGRAYILIDRGGTVRWTLMEEHPGLRRENDELLDRLRALG